MAQIISLKSGVPEKWYEKFVINSIIKASGSEWTHTQILVEGVMYESTFPGGFKKTENYVFKPNKLSKIQSFKEEWTERETGALIAYWEDKIRRKIKYGVLKLFVFMFLAGTKKFWDKIGWIPMSIDAVWGDFCSAAVDNSVRFSKCDLLPGNEEYTAPGDIIESNKLEE